MKVVIDEFRVYSDKDEWYGDFIELWANNVKIGIVFQGILEVKNVSYRQDGNLRNIKLDI